MLLEREPRRASPGVPRRLRILTWHVHGNYLYYLTRGPHEWFVPVDIDRPGGPRSGYAPLGRQLPWGPHVHAVPVEVVRDLDFDVVIYQSSAHWTRDRFELLSSAQRALPTVVVEHDPPRDHPTDTRHPVQDRSALLVHVTAFNRLMWDSGITPACTIEHGVVVPDDVRHIGELRQGIVVVNHLARRGRRLGADVYLEARRRVPLVLVGMASEELPGGLGEIANAALPGFMARYRFFFNPIRWTSLGLAVVEAMTIGMPIVGLATTEMVRTIENDRSGWIDTDPKRLVDVMEQLLRDASLARRWGDGAREAARARFSIDRFVADWNGALALVMG